MGFSCGIVGLPNVGKSTIFNALSKAQNAESANYPFCTIDPNRGIVPVPDNRMEFITKYVKPKSIIPTTVEFVDIAGLVKGASKGEGLGNKFLTHIRQVDAIVHVVRCFESTDIIHVEGEVNPKKDIDIIQTELLISDLEVLERALQKTKKNSKSGDKTLKQKAEVIEILVSCLSEGQSLKRVFNENPHYIEFVSEYQLLTSKPMLYVANVDEEGLIEDNEYVKIVKDIAIKEDALVIKISGKTECDLLDLSADDAKEYLSALGLDHSGLENLIIKGYELLGLITFFTAGEKEVRAWTVEKGNNAQKSAGKIHSDIERGFIRAEVCSYKDFVELKSLSSAKEKGRLRLEGKEYLVQDGDIIYFRFNV